MPLSIGQILIELGLNSVSFTKGLSTISIESKRTAKEIQGAFSEIGGTLSGLLGQFGPLGQAIGSVFTEAASAAGKATSAFGGMGGAAGLLGASLGAVAGLSAAAGVAGLGLAAHAAEGAAKLYELSEATSVSVETLSRYGYIARQSGVDSETVTKGLEKLAKSAFAAATAPEGTVNAFTRLHIETKNVDGSMRPLSDIMSDLADKFKAMGNTPERTALAMQMFGKGGAALIPILAEGSEGIKKMSDEADAFGVTISGQTGAASQKFVRTLDQIKEAGVGVGNQLMIQLLPALQTVASEFVNALKDPDSGLRSMITLIGILGKAILTVGEFIVTIFSDAKNIIWGAIATIQEGISGLGNVIWDVLHGRFDLLADDAKKAGSSISNAMKASALDSRDTWKSFGDSVQKIWSDAGAPVGSKPPQPKSDDTDLTKKPGVAAKAEKDIVQELVDKLIAQANAEERVSQAITGSAYAIAIKKAQIEADLKVEDTYNKLKERQAQLEKEQASAAGTKKAPQIASQLAETKKQLDELDAAKPFLEQLAAVTAANKETSKLDEALNKQTQAVVDEAKAYDILAASAFSSAAEQREAAARVAEAKFAADNPELATQARKKEVYDNALKQQDLAYQKTILQAAAQDDLNKKYEDEITRLNDIRNVLVANGRDTLVADAKIYDAQRSINAEWDAAAIKVGDFKQVAAGTLDTLAQKAENFGATLSRSVIQGVDSATSSLAKFIATGSATNFKQIGQQLEESIIGGVMKSGVSNLASSALKSIKVGGVSLGSLLPGSAPDGTQNNPLYVNMVNNPFAGGAPPLTSFGNIFGGGGDNSDSSGGSGGGFFSTILSGLTSFLPKFAGGGDVVPGAAYIVGEQRPELFVPDRPGKIVPDLSKLVPSQNGLQASVTMHVHGVSDTDSFKRAAPQIAAEMYRQMAAAHARNGGM